LALGFAALAGLLLVPLCAFAKDSVPQWMRDAAAEKLPLYSSDTDAVVLLDERTLTVQGPGKTMEHRRLVIRILRPQGRDYADFGTTFDKDSKIDSMHIWSIGPDGHEYQLRDDQIANRGVVTDSYMFMDLQERGGKAPANDPGSVVTFEYERKIRPYMSEDIWDYQSELPLHHATYTVELPPSFEYRTTWFHHAPVEPVNAGSNRWQWTLNDVPAVDVRHVAMHPSPMALEERMSVHYFGPGVAAPFRGDWKSIGQWYAPLEEGRFAPSAEITAKTKELTAGKTDFYAKSAAIAGFLQREIRYYAVEVGIGGLQPHPAADVFRNRYGDCKDKATLLLSMLEVAGVHGRLLMVDDRRGVIDPKSPSVLGDHMIAAVEVPEGADTAHLYSVVKAQDGTRYVIFDPTQEYIPFGQLPAYEQGSYGILMAGDKSQILALPVESPDRSTVTRSATFALHADGSLSGDVTERRYGDAAWYPRERLLSSDQKQRDALFDRIVRQDLASATIAGVKIDHLKDVDQDLEFRYSVSEPQYGKSAGTLLLLRPRVFGRDSPDVDHQMDRKLPIDLEQASVEKDDYTIELPPGYSVDELPDPVKVDTGFALYESKSSVQGNVLHYTRSFTVRELELPAAKYGDLVKLAGLIQADEQSSAVLKRTP
jgi:hypothetical protein